MITKITDETTVKEIREVLKWMGGCCDRSLCSLRIFDDLSGDFYDWKNNIICNMKILSDYISMIQNVENLKSLSKTALSEYIKKILEDPEKSKIIIDAIRDALDK